MPRILVVEDSRTQATQLRMLLEKNSFEVDVASNGAEALAHFASFSPDLVLTDMQMPEMNGLELVDAASLQYNDVPIILMTAQGSDELAVEALNHGAAAYIPKTRLNEVLLDTISEVLGLLRADRTYSELIGCLHFTEFRFALPNETEMIDPLVDLMQQMATGMNLCGPIERVRLGMALKNALTNAMFRGNLELGSDLLKRTSEDSKLVAQRLKESPYCDRRVFFLAELSDDQACFTIRDQGPGFDTSALPEPGDPFQLDREGGCGLVLMRSFMDTVDFNDEGNEVTMVKRRQGLDS